MSIEVISIGSSSSGNSYIIRAGERAILLDVGLTAKRITGALADAGLEPEEVDAVLVTHEHTDHVKSVRAISRKCCNAVFYATRGTVEGTENFAYVPEERLCIVSAGDSFAIGAEACSFAECAESDAYDEDAEAVYAEDDVVVRVFTISHDAREPVGYTVSCGGEKLAVVTDTGIITDEIYDAIHDADKLVFEANHDENLLMYGEYPYPVKVRIKSDRGHLSNAYSGEVLSRILQDRRDAAYAVACASDNGLVTSRENISGTDAATASVSSAADSRLDIMLAHLSFHNNAPYYARNTIEPILRENGFEKDVDYTLAIAAKDETTIF